MNAELIRNALAFACSLPMRLVPSRLRFGLVTRLAAFLTPLAGRVLLRRHGNVVGSGADETARVLFRAAARMRLAFDVEFTSEIDEDVLSTLREGGALFATAHFPLNPLFTRWLFDRGHHPLTIRDGRGGAPVIWGTSARLDLLHPGSHVLLQLRAALRAGRPVLVAVDRARSGVRKVSVESRFGTTSIATPVFALAAKMNVPVFFVGARATRDGSAVVTVRRIPPDPQAFVKSFSEHVGRMLP